MRSRLYRIADAHALVDLDFAGHGDADPGGLHIEHLEQGIVVLVEQDWGAGGCAQFHRASHVIDVGVGDDDLLDLQVMLAKEREDVLNVIAGVNDHGLARSFVADDRTVALQLPDGKDFVDHASIVASCDYRVPLVPGGELRTRFRLALWRDWRDNTPTCRRASCGQISSARISGPRPRG